MVDLHMGMGRCRYLDMWSCSGLTAWTVSVTVNLKFKVGQDLAKISFTGIWPSLYCHIQANTRMGRVNCRGKYVVITWNDCRVKYMNASAGWQKKVPFESLYLTETIAANIEAEIFVFCLIVCHLCYLPWILKPWVCIILFKGLRCLVQLNRQQKF